VAENWSVQELLVAGWREADLAWETTAERTVEAAAMNDPARARDEAGQALQLARTEFESADPRLGTSLANYGVCLALAGDTNGAPALFDKGLEAWRSAGPWIARMDAPRVARSSLFHLRMELRHRETYRARWQKRWQEIAAEAVARIEGLSTSPAASPPASDALARWRRERPAMLNDTRKLMAAAFLLLAPVLWETRND
jgi:hypothetical protein